MLRVLTLMTFFVMATAFAEDVKTSTTKKKKVAPAAAPKQWSSLFSLNYYPDAKEQKDTYMFNFADINYMPSKTHRFRVFQRAIYSLNALSEEQNNNTRFNLLNTRVMYYYNFEPPADKSYSLAFRLASELGTSQQSQDDGLYAISNVRLEFNKKWGNTLVCLRPYLNYWSTEYSTNQKNEPMPLFSVAHNLYIESFFTKKFFADIELDTGVHMLQPAEVQAAQAAQPNASNTGKPLETSRTVMWMIAEFGYLFTKNVAVRVGYYQADKMVSDGNYALPLFAEKTTRYFLALDFMF